MSTPAVCRRPDHLIPVPGPIVHALAFLDCEDGEERWEQEARHEIRKVFTRHGHRLLMETDSMQLYSSRIWRLIREVIEEG